MKREDLKMIDSSKAPLTIALTFRGDKLFGGAERRLLRAFNEVGFKHRVVFLARACSRAELEKCIEASSCDIDGIDEIICCSNKGKILGTVASLKLLAQIKPDVIATFDDGPFNRVMIQWARIAKKPVLLTIANDLYYSEALKGKKNRMLKKIVRDADHIDLLYPRQEEYYRTLIQGKTELTITPGTFTSLNIFQPATKRKQFVFIAARLEDYKNPKMVLEAAILCAPSLREHGYEVVICGRGWEEDSLKREIADKGVSDIVKMPGYVKPHEILPSAKVLCATNLINNYPSQTIAEAAACGCFLIATEVGETCLLLDPSYSVGIPPSAQALAAKMEWYMGLDPKTQNDYAVAARAYAQKHFSIERSKEYFLSICENLAEYHALP